MIDPEFIEMVQRTLRHYRQLLASSRDLALYVAKHENVLHAAEIGLLPPETRSLAIDLLLTAFPYAERHGLWSQWLALFEQAVATQPDASILPHLLNRQAVFLRRLQRLEAAETLFQRVVASADRVAGTMAHFNLSVIYRSQGAYAAAETAAHTALAGYQQTADKKGEATTLHTLGLIARAQGEHQQAGDYLRQSLACWDASDQPALKTRTLNSLAVVLTEQADLDSAVALLRQLHDLLQSTQNHLEVAQVENNLGRLHYQRKQFSPALGWFQSAWRYAKKTADLPTRAAIAQNLGNTLIALDMGEQAIFHLLEATRLMQIVAPNSMELANSVGTLAQAYQQVGDGEAAEQHFAHTFALLDIFGEHPRTINLRSEFTASKERLFFQKSRS